MAIKSAEHFTKEVEPTDYHIFVDLDLCGNLLYRQLDATVVEEVGKLRQCLPRLLKETATSEADGVSAVLRRAAPSLAVTDLGERLLLHHRVAFWARHNLCQKAVLTYPLSAGVLVGGRQMKLSHRYRHLLLPELRRLPVRTFAARLLPYIADFCRQFHAANFCRCI